MIEDLETRVLRALADPDRTVQMMAAVRAHKVLPRSNALLAALESLLVHEDKYLRRAAAASYVALHERGARAPALERLREDPSDLVALTARGALLDPGHEIAELNFVVRAIARATHDASPDGATPFATTAARWHRFLWLYSPNPRAGTVMNAVTREDLDRDSDQLRDALAALLRERRVPSQVTQLQVFVAFNESDELEVRGFVDGRSTWGCGAGTQLAGFRGLCAYGWDEHDAPWPAMFAAGCFALAVARAIEATPSIFIGDAEREVSTCLHGEQLFLGFLRPTGMSYAD